MPTHKEYTLVTIGDMLRVVNADNLEALIADMRGLLINAALTNALLSDAGLKEELYKDVEITWCDDNVNQQTLIAKSPKGEELQFVLTGPNAEEPEA